MADRLEAMIAAAMDDVFGDRFETADSGKPPYNSDPHFLHMLTVAGDQDDDACELIERHLTMESEITGFRDSIAKLMTEHDDDENYKARCRKAFKARADLIGLQQRMLLLDWWPGLRHAGRPM
ncbi:hypothetical protein KMZ68_13820 [Bradyrhizobium sediminis]|uniref:Uncharacterized protein n=1 Tax=Bradyrhizobium sediminis TaxID=2840469 RepID=A0A975RPT3_9BRAD|nr:hypothetical protein [Bradyrhizobium sediminis]QWG16122.1 hypothetical protein KMZ68_13820 [Bradyrhizobium sediminis]